MATILKHRRDTTTALDAIKGAQGEITYDVTTKQLRAMDGATDGGNIVARVSQLFGIITHNFSSDANYAIIDEESMNYRLEFTDTLNVLTTSRTVILPNRASEHRIKNSTDWPLNVSTGIAGGQEVTIQVDAERTVTVNGIDCYEELNNQAAVYAITNVTQLRQYEGTARQTVYLRGFSSDADGGQGYWFWDPNSTSTDNGGIVVQVSGVTTGRWHRLFDNFINVKWFGAKGDNSTDDTAALNNTLAASTLGTYDVYFPAGQYKISSTITIENTKLSANLKPLPRIIFGHRAQISTMAEIDAIFLKGEMVELHGIELEGYKVSGGNTDRGVIVGIQNNTAYANFCRLVNVVVRDFGSHGVHWIEGEGLIFDKVLVTSNGGSGLYVPLTSVNNQEGQFYSSQFSGNDVGVEMNGTGGGTSGGGTQSVFHWCKAFGNTNGGFKINVGGVKGIIYPEATGSGPGVYLGPNGGPVELDIRATNWQQGSPNNVVLDSSLEPSSLPVLGLGQEIKCQSSGVGTVTLGGIHNFLGISHQRQNPSNHVLMLAALGSIGSEPVFYCADSSNTINDSHLKITRPNSTQKLHTWVETLRFEESNMPDIMKGILFNSATLDHGTVAAGNYADQTFTAGGSSVARGTSTISVNPDFTLPPNIGFNAWVSNTSTITIRVFNNSGSPLSMGSVTWIYSILSFETA